jgi:hypothetical protein
MTLIVNKITQTCSDDHDLLDQALDQASRAYEKAFLSDRLVQEDFVDSSFDCSVQDEEFDYEPSQGMQISAQLFNLMQELKSCHTSTIGEERNDVSNEDILHDLKLQMQEDVSKMPEILAAQDEGDFLEQALEYAAQQYEKAFALDRLAVNNIYDDDAELFYDCNEFNIDDDLLKMYMPTTSSACSISDSLFDIVKDVKGMQVKEANEAEGVVFRDLDMASELELCMLEDLNDLSPGEVGEPEIVSRALAPHPKKLASVRNKSAVTCSLPLGSFVNARSPCGGMPCGSPKKVTASPASAAWRSPACAAWRSQRI